MNFLKWLVVAIAVAVSGLGVMRWRQALEAENARLAAGAALEQMQQKIAGLESRLATEKKRTAEVESDNAGLRLAVEKTKQAKIKSATPTVSRMEFEAMAKAAIALAWEQGDSDEALQGLLKCFDVGMAQRNGLSMVAQISMVVGALGRMGETRPEAAAALRERLEKARQRVMADPDDTDPIQNISLLSRALKDDSILVSLYDALPAGDNRRRMAGIYARDALLEAQRYREVVEITPFSSMSSNFESNMNSAALKMETATRYLATSAAKNIEALAGVGDLEHARALAKRLLAFDGSDETKAALQARLVRAGQPGLLK